MEKSVAEHHLEIRLLGAPVLRLNGESVRPETTKTLALLVYLAMEGGHQRRDTLAALFWGDKADRRAAANLRRAFWNLRRVLHPGGEGDCPYLDVDRREARFNPRDAWLDVEQFERLAHSPANLPPHEQRTHLQQAVDLYRGDFLTGLSLDDAPVFERWMLGQRAYLREQAFRAFHRLSKIHATHGNYAQAVDTLRRFLTLAPWREETHRQVMLMLALQGEREQALRQYKHCTRILAKELDAEPTPETQSLYRRIRSGEITVEATGTAAPALPFVGRGPAYAWVLAQRREPGLTLIEGEAGVGKTRLLHEVLQHAAGAGASVLRGRSYEFQDAVPYHAVTEAIAAYLKRMETLAHLRLPDEPLSELARLVPALCRLCPEVEPARPQDTVAARERSFDSVAVFLRALPRPILFLDDLHWADTGTLDLLHYLIRALEETPCWFVGAYRPEETPLDHALTRLRQALSRDGLVHRRRLAPLTARDVAQATAKCLAADASRGAEDEALAAYLFGQSGGNPFILTEALRTLEDQGMLQADGAMWRLTGQLDEHDVLPLRVQEVILQRVGRLSAEARWPLEVASVIGRPFTLTLLARAAGLAPDTVADHAATWQARQLLRCDDADRYDFTHDKIRASIYEHLPEHAQQLLHGRLGQALLEGETRLKPLPPPPVADEQAARVAYHFERSLAPQRAAPYLAQAAEAALNVYAHASAIDYYQRALPLLSRDEDRAEVLIELAHAQQLTGCWDEAKSLYQQAIELAEGTGEHQTRARAWYLLADAQESQGKYRAALKSATQAERAARAAGPAGRESLAAALHRKGWAAFRLGDAERAMRLGKETLTLSREIRAWKWQADSLNLLSAIHNHRDDYDQAVECMEQALALYREAGHRRGEAVMLGNLGNTSYLRGDYEAAVTRYRQGLKLAREIGHRYTEMLCLNNLGGALVALDEYEAAEEQLQQVLNVPGSEQWFLLPDTYRYLAEARLALGHLDQARKAARRVLALVQARKEPAPEYTGTAWRILGEIAARKREPVTIEEEACDAERCFDQSLKKFKAAGMAAEAAQVKALRADYR